MQTLGISDSTPGSESRLKSLFWPSIESGADVEYLAVQGYWVCTVVAALSLALLFAGHQPVLGIVIFLFFHLGGVGVREYSIYFLCHRYACTIVQASCGFAGNDRAAGDHNVFASFEFSRNMDFGALAVRLGRGRDASAAPRYLVG